MMRIILLLFVVVLAAAGCDRTLDSENLPFGPPSEPPVPIGLKIVHLSDGIELSWEVRDSADIDHFNVYYTDDPEGDYIFWDSTPDFSIVISELTAAVPYYFRVATVTTGSLEGGLSAPISSRIGVISMVINGDDEYTNSRQVRLNYVFPVDPLLVQISESPDFSGAYWRGFTQPGDFTLSAGDGEKSVYVRFRFSDGSESRDAVSDDIILDTHAAIDAVYFSPVSGLNSGEEVTFYVETEEAGGEVSVSFPGIDDLMLNDEGLYGDATPDDGLYSRRYVLPLDYEVENGIVTANFTDIAGNMAESVSSPLYLNVAPIVVEIILRVVAESSASIRLNWSSPDVGNFVSYRIYRDTALSVSESSELVTIINSQTTLEYTDENLEDSTFYAYRVYVYGPVGVLTNSNPSGVRTRANLPPAPVTIGVNLIDSLSISITWTANDDDDFASYRIFRGLSANVDDENGQRLTVINSQSQTSFVDFRPTSAETYFYVIYVYDRQGLRSDASNVVATP